MVVVALSPARAGAVGKQPTAVGTGGAAASVDPLATAAAIDVLSKGGNAFDAAIAAAGVLGVVEPYSCGIGGGGFMVFRDGETGKIMTLDSREKAPAAMQPNSFFINGVGPTDAQFPINRYSGLSSASPGRRTRGRTCCATTAPTRSRRRSTTARGSPPTASWSTRPSTTRRIPTTPGSTTSRAPPRSTSTPTARRATSGPSCATPTSPRPTSCSAPRASPRASTAARSPTRSSRRRRPSRSAPPPTTRGGPA